MSVILTSGIRTSSPRQMVCPPFPSQQRACCGSRAGLTERSKNASMRAVVAATHTFCHMPRESTLLRFAGVCKSCHRWHLQEKSNRGSLNSTEISTTPTCRVPVSAVLTKTMHRRYRSGSMRPLRGGRRKRESVDLGRRLGASRLVASEVRARPAFPSTSQQPGECRWAI